MKVDPALAEVHREDDGTETLHLSDAGRITQFGAFLETLPPGAFSSHRHWHENEDEMLLMIQGQAITVDDDGRHPLGPLDAACWRHGDPNGHQVRNESDAPLRYIIIGTRIASDICHYSDDGRTLINTKTDWRITNAKGEVLRQGDLPEVLLNLPEVWGTPFDPLLPAERIQLADDADWQDDDAPHAILGPGPGPYRYRLISDLGGISQFGAFIEELPPGSSSGRRHWHEREDEMIVMLDGEVILVEDTETQLHAGDTAAWAAGTPIGHRLDNRSNTPARYLVIGTRFHEDRVHYTDHDLITEKTGTARRYLHRDGTPYGGH
ncbi:MAG: hypothetical protein DI533_08920 [Cereibacter sphaeroides]|uniref:Cupin type-2 domain-containing protein n=1 Tax=Cereibacter sphaeroides TaxID=1063 RepID=A0A2W5SMS0_CERSP|nr:MAG: hypothetical protein DI533_08920 [Cereibacter sphaeroides]